MYVRDPENKDLSHVVDKVVFKLHDSFEKPVRVVEAPPFELTETGWGEFEIGITVRLPRPLCEPTQSLPVPLSRSK